MRLHLLLFTSLAVAGGKLSPFKGHRGLTPTTSSNPSLVLRQACASLESECDSFYCIPASATCCYGGLGAYCEVGKYCVVGGCCDDGEVCDTDGGIIDNTCDADEVECGSMWCMPADGVCCGSGMYCEAGQTCDGIFCSGGDNSDIFTDDDTEDDFDDDDIEDIFADDDTEDEATVCKRKSRGGSSGKGGGGGGFDSDDDGDSGDDGCGGGGSSGSMVAPLALTGLVGLMVFLV